MNNPQIVQTTRDKFTDPVETRTPVGDTKIPDPIIQPTITVQPLSKVISALSLIGSSLTSSYNFEVFLAAGTFSTTVLGTAFDLRPL